MDKILLIDDEKKLMEVLVAYVKQSGFIPIPAYTGTEALKLFHDEKPALVVLDLMLPDLNGEEVCRQIRRVSSVPIIMLTAKGQLENRLTGLQLGADDYLVKPISPKELILRIQNLLRRSQFGIPLGKIFLSKDFWIDLEAEQVFRNNHEIHLTPIEFQLLSFFIRNPNRPLSRSLIIEKTLGYDYEGDERTIDVHIKNLRKKLEDDPKSPKLLVTVFGKGYRFEVTPS